MSTARGDRNDRSVTRSCYKVLRSSGEIPRFHAGIYIPLYLYIYIYIKLRVSLSLSLSSPIDIFIIWD